MVIHYNYSFMANLSQMYAKISKFFFPNQHVISLHHSHLQFRFLLYFRIFSFLYLTAIYFWYMWTTKSIFFNIKYYRWMKLLPSIYLLFFISKIKELGQMHSLFMRNLIIYLRELFAIFSSNSFFKRLIRFQRIKFHLIICFVISEFIDVSFGFTFTWLFHFLKGSGKIFFIFLILILNCFDRSYHLIFVSTLLYFHVRKTQLISLISFCTQEEILFMYWILDLGKFLWLINTINI